MAINSANELHELVETLGQQFRDAHHPAAQSLWSQADNHIEHALLSAGHWVARELQQLHGDWQVHKYAIQDAETWFAHHGSMLATVARRPVSLATTALAGPLGQILTGIGAASGTVGSVLGTPLIGHNILEVLRVSGNKNLKSYAKSAGKSGESIDEFFSAHRLSHYGAIVDGGGKVLAGAGVVFGGIHIANDLGTYQKQLATGDVYGAGMTGADIVASGLKAYPNPISYVAGVGVSIIADDVDAATKVDWNLKYMPPWSWQSMHDVYLPGAGDGLRESAKKIWEAF